MVKFTFPAFFFNRTKEIKQITTTLSFQEPQLTVMLGPPSSGKTALMRHVIEQKDNNTPLFHPIRIDLRAVDISAQDSLYSSILDQVSTQRPKFFGLVKSLEIGLPGNISTTSHFRKPSNLVDLLGVLKSQFRPFSVTRPVVLVVDEANEFKNLKNKDDLKTFLRFAVEVSKQESKCHVVFTSSDPFFESWLEKEIPRTHFKTVVLGDLPVDEAFQFYLNELNDYSEHCPTFPSHLFDKDFESFKENVFIMTGGRMWFISRYIGQVHIQEKRIGSPIEFEAVNDEVTGLELRVCKSKDYTEKEFKTVLERLTQSNSGYIEYKPLVKILGEEKVSAMIRDNVLHYRPPSPLARDLIPPPDHAVVTAPSQPALLAMKYLLKRL